MSALRIQSVSNPFADPAVSKAASTLLSRAETMGFLDELGSISKLDAPLIATLLERLGQVGLLQRAIMQGAIENLPRDPARLVSLLDQANAALEDSPLPAQEWAALRAILGDVLLARLSGISQASLRRYATSTRSTPDAVAQRVHTLALIVADLRGAYNDQGVRRWFGRPRAQLGGRAPEEILRAGWTPDSPEVAMLRELAGALNGSPAT